tara:strand:+ start:702 stop:896 length:195 start_codon:yes stop_codon:yes gene_type:complete
MLKNAFLYISLGFILVSALDDGLRKSTLNQCTRNNDNKACNYLVKNGTSYQKKIATQTLLIRGF